jgi:SMC domain-containing protein
MFNLINIGERAGSGVPNIFNVWADEGWEEPVIEERFDPDRTVLSLSFVKKVAKKNGEKKWRKKVTKKTQEKYDAILNAMQPDKWYKAYEFESIAGVKESRIKVLLKDMTEEFQEFDRIVARNKIEEYNKVASKSNAEYNQQVAELSAIRNSLVTLRTQMIEKEQIIKNCQREIKEFDEQSSETIKKIQEEKRICEFNAKIIEAYNKIIGSLIDYNNELPRQIAQDLEQRIVDYYNTINQDDADFEKIGELILPDATSDKMYITFADGSTSEALQVLSEGHIKILGLSILLAKAVHDNLNFIIFDDIVNAIDDDHRNGVADLLMNHADFANIQIILSTHGDQFIFKLQDKLGQKRVKENAIVYKFIPADSLEERGVIVEYSDSKTPLMAAEDKYNKNETKDAASKCRQAMECISYNLWNLIAKSSDATISVGMRSPKSLPDLSSIVDGLIKKTSKIKGMEDINAELKSLKEAGNWRVLNKGTHFEDEQKEFERADIKCVYDHLVKLDDMIRNMKIVNSAETK